MHNNNNINIIIARKENYFRDSCVIRVTLYWTISEFFNFDQ